MHEGYKMCKLVKKSIEFLCDLTVLYNLPNNFTVL